jgi:hypothetical protein
MGPTLVENVYTEFIGRNAIDGATLNRSGYTWNIDEKLGVKTL